MSHSLLLNSASFGFTIQDKLGIQFYIRYLWLPHVEKTITSFLYIYDGRKESSLQYGSSNKTLDK